MTVKPCFAQNAMIVSDDGAHVRFHPVCPHCGKVMTNTTGGGYCMHGTSNVGRYSCICGGGSFPIVLHRG